MKRDDDSILVEGVQRGDTVAFDELVKRYRRRMYDLAYRMLGDVAKADDATQEIFLRAYKGLSQFSGRTSFATWLYRVAVNVCQECVRCPG